MNETDLDMGMQISTYVNRRHLLNQIFIEKINLNLKKNFLKGTIGGRKYNEELADSAKQCF